VSDFVKKLCEDINLQMPEMEKDKSYILAITDDIEIKVWDLEPGFYLHNDLILCPAQKKENLFIYLMRANHLGQGTGGSRIGLDKEEKFLTLSYNIAYEVKYIEFKDKVEDFVNYIVFWRNEIETYKKKAEETIL